MLIQNSVETNPFKAFGTSDAIGVVMLDSHDSLAPHPESPNQPQKAGLIDAVRLCIRAGKDDILNVLLQTHENEALNPGAFFPLYLDWNRVEGSNILLRLLGFSNEVTRQFPRFLWGRTPRQTRGPAPRLTNERDGQIYQRRHTWPLAGDAISQACFSDGRLNYALLYMILTINTPHRDLEFANILLHVYQLDFVNVNRWVPANFFE